MEIKNRKVLLLISVSAIIIIAFIFFLSFFESPDYTAPWMRPGRPPAFQVYMLPVYFLLIGLVIVPLSYYFVSKRLENKIEKSMKILLKLASKNSLHSSNKQSKTGNKDIILKFLNPTERRILEKLGEGKGTALQAEISRMEGMTKLKTHRAVKDLVMKGIVKTETYGKTKRIVLSKDVKDVLQL